MQRVHHRSILLSAAAAHASPGFGIGGGSAFGNCMLLVHGRGSKLAPHTHYMHALATRLLLLSQHALLFYQRADCACYCSVDMHALVCDAYCYCIVNCMLHGVLTQCACTDRICIVIDEVLHIARTTIANGDGYVEEHERAASREC